MDHLCSISRSLQPYNFFPAKSPKNLLWLNSCTNSAGVNVLAHPIIFVAFAFLLTVAITRLVLKQSEDYDIAAPRTLIKSLYRHTRLYAHMRGIALVLALLFARLFPVVSTTVAVLCGLHAGMTKNISEQQKRLEQLKNAYS